jgi:hypothetical protein
MEEAWLQALAQVKIYLCGTTEMAFRVPKAERHRLIEPVRMRFGAARHGCAGTDMWIRDIERMTRLVRPYRKDGIAVEPAPRAPNHGFTRRPTATDALVEMAGRLPSWDSIRITARSPSITKLPGYWKRYGSSSPHHAPDTPTIPLGGVQERRSRVQTYGLCPTPPHGAGLVNDFCANHLNPYVNFHRQCFFLETITVPRGRSAGAIATRNMKTL